MNFPNNNNQNYNNNDYINQNPYANMNKMSSGTSDVNNIPDPQNDKTMKIDEVSHSKDGNSIDIKNFMDDMDNKNTIHKISSANDLGIIGEVSFLFLLFFSFFCDLVLCLFYISGFSFLNFKKHLTLLLLCFYISLFLLFQRFC